MRKIDKSFSLKGLKNMSFGSEVFIIMAIGKLVSVG